MHARHCFTGATIGATLLLSVMAGCADSDTNPTQAANDEVANDNLSQDNSVATCRPLVLEGHLERLQPGIFMVRQSIEAVGAEGSDAFVFEFFEDDIGTFDLASPVNRNYATCEQCVRLHQDVTAFGPDPSMPQFFQSAGTIHVETALPTTETDQLSVTLENLTLSEVTLAQRGDFWSTLVEDGGCFALEGPVTLSTPRCTPSCAGRVCGPDGCGGSCGAGCGDEGQCSLDGTMCLTGSECQRVELGEALVYDATHQEFASDATSPQLGALEVRERLQLEFYAGISGEFPLDTDGNENYAICNQCVRFFIDLGEGQREFFQRSGNMIVDPSSDLSQGKLSVTLQDVQLAEVELDPRTFESTPVASGACISFAPSVTLSTDAGDGSLDTPE